MSMTDADVLDRIDALELAVQELRNHLVVPLIEPAKPNPKPDVRVDDVVLIGAGLPQWAGCLARVHALKSWGVQAWAVGPAHPDFPRAAEFPVRVTFEQVAAVFREIKT